MFLKCLLIFLVMFFLLYCVIPNYWNRNCSKRVIRCVPSRKKVVALTFDDGPNPLYTEKLLDILSQHKIPASFFLVGKNVQAYPYIVNRIVKKGHSIGCHSFYHKHAWLSSPVNTYMDIKKSCDTIKDISGLSPKWYRPPWGTFNLFSLRSSSCLSLKTVYWSIDARDWSSKTSPDYIVNTITENISPGSIIVLHDSGGDRGAPENTLMALPKIIEKLKTDGYTFVSLDDVDSKLKHI